MKTSEVLTSLQNQLSKEPTNKLKCEFILSNGEKMKAEFHKDDFISCLSVMIKTEQRMEK